MKYVVVEKPIKARGVEVPGGWRAPVPEVRPDGAAMVALSRAYQSLGMTPANAQTMTYTSVQEVFESRWITGLRQAIARWAKEYVKSFGDLRGFDPEKMAHAYVPHAHAGKGGKPRVRNLFGEMRRNA